MLTQEEQEVLAAIRAERMAKQPNYEALATANIRKYKQQFDEVHHWDKTDYQICIVCGFLGAIMDSLFVGIPQASQKGEPTGFWRSLCPEASRVYFVCEAEPGNGGKIHGAGRNAER